jgi:2',3'-cyclic-nucleotide 2'-phosphodiesterase
MNVLFIADIFGSPGRQIVSRKLPALRESLQIDVCIANCENVASGRGITEKKAAELFDLGVDVMTGGNHLWDRKEVLDYLKIENRIIRPLNFPARAIGSPFFIKTLASGTKLAIVNLIGQAFMGNADSPIDTLEKILPELRSQTPNIFVDFHAEATAEKRGFGLYFAGKVSAVIGTHTHIQTADEELLPEGTAYITDAGMTGPHDSVIGIRKEIIFERMITGLPTRFEVADSGLQLNAVLITIDDKTGKATYIRRIREKL